MPRRALLAPVLIALLLALPLAFAPAADAATTCKRYDSYTGGDYAADGVTWTNWAHPNVTVCAAPSSDFPTYSGWGRMLASTDGIRAGGCGSAGLLPLDVDDPELHMPCLDTSHHPRPAAATTWSWTVQGWRTGPAIHTGARAYFAPYASGWRWGWTQKSGWFAIPAKNAYFLWYA